MTLRIGILGASRIAELAIVAPAHELGHRLVAVAARDPGRARDFAEKYGVERVLPSYAAVVSDPQVDVVYNPLANALHAPWNLAAITAGKSVLTEKPFARNSVEALSVHNAATTSKATVMEGFHYLFHPVTVRLADLASHGELGTLRRIEVDMAMPAPPPSDPRWSLEMAGGALMDLGCYGLHVMRVLASRMGGSACVVSARAGQPVPGVDAWCDVELALPHDVSGLSTNSMVAERYSFTIKVIGTAGTALAHNFVQPHIDDRITVRTSSGNRVERGGRRSSYSYQLEAFAGHLLGGRPLPLSTADAVANMALVDAAYEAAGMSPR